jgi:superfamily II DNA or RNA helicase
VPFEVCWTAPPSIVAESLQAVPDPLVTVLRPGPPASGVAVVASLARALTPEEALDPPPLWLLPEQVQSFRRVLATLRRYGGALLSDPVGSGKTYVALAAAAALNRGPTACLVPATLRAQWSSIAATLGVPVSLCSHEQASRGRLPRETRGLVLIDESHHYRHPAIRRYRHVASWLVGRTALMITATPVVNHAADLCNQLLLAVPDDALLLDGVVSLRTLLAKGCTAASLGQLVIESGPAGERRPGIVRTITRTTAGECFAVAQIVELLGRLQLSRSPSVAALLRRVLLRSAGSSPAALVGTLARYRRLLLHARDAYRLGQVLDRSEIRRFTAELGDQLLWWELFAPTEMTSDIDLNDLNGIDELIEAVSEVAAAGDEKLQRLGEILSDGTPSLVFTSFRETVRHVRDRIADARLAWCTGRSAGIGHTRVPRSTVLAAFRAGVSSSIGPRHLVVTDVAAEGLNLQRAGRVIHYDLPWTPMRMDQREGRSVRYGSSYAQVEVVRFTPPPVLERWLGLERLLERKSRLPAILGLGSHGKQVWRWRSELGSRFAGGEAVAGAALVASEQRGLLAGFSLHSGGPPAWLSSTVLWLLRDGTWTEAPEVLAARLEEAAGQVDIMPIDDVCLRSWLVPLAVAIKDRLTLAGSRRWIIPEPNSGSRRVAARLQASTREAARMHRPDRLMELELAMSFITRGHTAGETALIERLAESSDAELDAALSRLPRRPAPCDGLEVRLSGLIVFGS